jgi:hypothetical protein
MAMNDKTRQLTYQALADLEEGKITEDQTLEIFLKAGVDPESAKETIGISLGVTDVIATDEKNP